MIFLARPANRSACLGLFAVWSNDLNKGLELRLVPRDVKALLVISRNLS